jgi:hypothetical protein
MVETEVILFWQQSHQRAGAEGQVKTIQLEVLAVLVVVVVVVAAQEAKRVELEPQIKVMQVARHLLTQRVL